LLTYLNYNPSYTNPSRIDPFASFPDQYGANQTDSTVTPVTINFSTIPFTLDNNYNFAVARVRLFGSSGPAGEPPMSGYSSGYSLRRPATPTITSTPTTRRRPTRRANRDHHLWHRQCYHPLLCHRQFPSQTDYADGGPNKFPSRSRTIRTGFS